VRNRMPHKVGCRERRMMEPTIYELVQIAAVACGAIEDARYGETFCFRWSERDQQPQGKFATSLIMDERGAQDGKWGPQHHTPVEWLMILLEEVGEAAELIGKERAESPDIDRLEDLYVINQAIYAGTSARQWLEGHEWPERQQGVYDKERHNA
jgi:hypothetical protein